ncbi:MAG: hypothetical protein AB2A00_27780 [Myxococcota bacterium]
MVPGKASRVMLLATWLVSATGLGAPPEEHAGSTLGEATPESRRAYLQDVQAQLAALETLIAHVQTAALQMPPTTRTVTQDDVAELRGQCDRIRVLMGRLQGADEADWERQRVALDGALGALRLEVHERMNRVGIVGPPTP